MSPRDLRSGSCVPAAEMELCVSSLVPFRGWWCGGWLLVLVLETPARRVRAVGLVGDLGDAVELLGILGGRMEVIFGFALMVSWSGVALFFCRFPGKKPSAERYSPIPQTRLLSRRIVSAQMSKLLPLEFLAP